MSTTPDQPYAPPSADLELRTGTADGVTPAMLDAFAGTKGWVRFLSVLLLVGAAVTVLGMLPLILPMPPVAAGSRSSSAWPRWQ